MYWDGRAEEIDAECGDTTMRVTRGVQALAAAGFVCSGIGADTWRPADDGTEARTVVVYVYKGERCGYVRLTQTRATRYVTRWDGGVRVLVQSTAGGARIDHKELS